MTTEEYREIADTIPKTPGVYRFCKEDGTILYVGKAKNLKNRVASYFGERRDRLFRTRIMVKNADFINFTVVKSETDALLLESALIKEHQPRYNVTLKDDKSYSYICIKNERFPRILITRRVIRDGSVYFGPYTSKGRLKIILDLLKQLFPLRTCVFNLSEENIREGKIKLCLEYHIKNCMGPCAGLESEAVYLDKIEQIKNILKGHFSSVLQHFKKIMNQYAEELAFEKAQAIKEKLHAFENYQAKSTVVSHTIKDVDVFTILTDEKEAYINYLRVVNGAIIQAHTQELSLQLEEEEPEDLLSLAIPIIRDRFNSLAPEVITALPVVLSEPHLKNTTPQIGDKKKLLELSQRNVLYYKLQKKKDLLNKVKRQSPAERILKQLQKDLNMADVPLHIDCFDNSNIQGTHPVSSCVVFKNARPSKKDYRHFHVKTVTGPNDFASMEEVVYRRYKRIRDEGKDLPQLVIIDGGKGQLGAAMKSITLLGLNGKMTVVGIAKRLEEIFFPDDSVPLYINKKSSSLKLIQQARNEAHRFAITFHRSVRSKSLIQSELENIAGIGEKTIQTLLSSLGSVKNIAEANDRILVELVGAHKSKLLRAYFDLNTGKNT
jgi:excinuclease ABC subunit C